MPEVRTEGNFRRNTVEKFLKTLTSCEAFSIQQKAIRGDADKILCVRGYFVWLELKKDGEDPDPLQSYKASCVRAAGGISMTARPENWNRISAFLKKLDAGIYDKTELLQINKEEK